MSYVRQGRGKLAIAVMTALFVLAALVATSIPALANDPPQWTNVTGPGIITFDVNVTYNDGSAEEQSASDSYQVTVIQVRAWELVDNEPPTAYKIPGTSTDFFATIWNLGNYSEHFDLSIEMYDLDAEGWVVPGLGSNPAIPDGWTVEIFVDDAEAAGVTVAAGQSKLVKVVVSADEDVLDDELLQVRLVATTPYTEPDIEGLSNLPSLAAKSEHTTTMAVHIVRNLMTFILTPGAGSSDDADTENLPREAGEAYPRDEVLLTGMITNPSWAAVPVTEGVSITATIVVPQEFTLDVASLPANEDLPYACQVSYNSENRTITITCGTAFPSGGELPISFRVKVNPYVSPSDEQTSYVFDGDLVYKDLSTTEREVPVDPEISVLGIRLVKLYDTANGTYPPDAPLELEPVESSPGKTETFDVWVRNEGNLVDSYMLKIKSQAKVDEDPKFSWVVECNENVSTTGDLAPGAELKCTVRVTFGPGTEDEDGADIVNLQAESTEHEDVLSNLFVITVDITAPNIVVTMTVSLNPGYSPLATQIKPGDVVYVMAEITNEGREDATNLNVTHNVPGALDFDGVVDIQINDVAVGSGQINVTGNEIKVGPVNLPIDGIMTIEYSGKVK